MERGHKSFDEVVDFHGHACPGLALGYRVSLAALGELGGRAGDEEMVAIVENDSCAVDAIQVVTGCTFGKGNLIYRDYGKQVYTFFRREDEEAVRIAVRWTPPPESATEKEMWKRYMAGERSDDVMRAVHDRKSRKMQAIMEAGDSELMDIRRVGIEPPAMARIHPSVTCAYCGEKVMEPRARLKDGKIVCIPCMEKNG